MNDKQTGNLPTVAKNQQVAKYQIPTSCATLQVSLQLLANPATNADERMLAKMAYQKVVLGLMPAGKPNYLDVVKYPMIRDIMKQSGPGIMLLMLSVMVRDFCACMNVVRNMNEDQIVEAATMMLQEAGNYRMEDYVMAFSMAKRGELIQIRDRIDLQVITELLDAYNRKRVDAKYDKLTQEVERQEVQLPIARPYTTPEDRKNSRVMDDRLTNFGSALSDMKAQYNERFPKTDDSSAG